MSLQLVFYCQYTHSAGLKICGQWAEGASPRTRFNRISHNWFDATTYLDWFKFIFLDLRLAKENYTLFLHLPPNSTHLTQLLDVAVFRPMKKI
ncbi:hypothetical protein PR048_017307 [Dryococelus australis]|uniref:DDE-1 domain-containing protein n=1 Tax=Dryococelus australis TaxID=614101 RepID=A0ABQ9H9D6_9NEOP|nr:hypothetical protein PR048_017307 [Dryococelus australis]